MFGSSSDLSLPPLIGAGGDLICESPGRQKCCQPILMESSPGIKLICHPSASLTTLAFRSREVKQLLLDLDSYGGTDPLGTFPLCLKKTAKVLAPHLSAVFRWLLRLGHFPVCWRVANVTPIAKGPPSSSASNYRPISVTPILSKVFECLVSVRLGRFMEGKGVLPTIQFTYRKGLGTCDAFLCVVHTLQSALEMGQEARIVQINFSAAFDRVNHQEMVDPAYHQCTYFGAKLKNYCHNFHVTLGHCSKQYKVNQFALTKEHDFFYKNIAKSHIFLLMQIS